MLRCAAGHLSQERFSPLPGVWDTNAQGKGDLAVIESGWPSGIRMENWTFLVEPPLKKFGNPKFGVGDTDVGRLQREDPVAEEAPKALKRKGPRPDSPKLLQA